MEVDGEFVVARRDGSPVLEAAEGSLDEVSGAVGFWVVGDRCFPGTGRGDDGFSPGPGETTTQAVCVIAFVGQQAGWRRPLVEQRRGCGDVSAVSRAQNEGDGPSASLCQGMDFGGWPATRTSPLGPSVNALSAMDGLNFRPPFPPCAERCARMAVESILRSSGSSACVDRVSKIRVQRPRWLQRLNRL